MGWGGGVGEAGMRVVACTCDLHWELLMWRRGAPPSPQVAGYMRAVLHTLAQCHSHRILHRDIKPGGWVGGARLG